MLKYVGQLRENTRIRVHFLKLDLFPHGEAFEGVMIPGRHVKLREAARLSGKHAPADFERIHSAIERELHEDLPRGATPEFKRIEGHNLVHFAVTLRNIGEKRFKEIKTAALPRVSYRVL